MKTIINQQKTLKQQINELFDTYKVNVLFTTSDNEIYTTQEDAEIHIKLYNLEDDSITWWYKDKI